MRPSLSVLLLAWGLFFVAMPLEAASPAPKLYLIPVTGTVDPGMAAYVKRAVETIGSDRSAMVLFQLDTFGGRVDSALEIVEAISRISADQSIAFVEKKAISAGALIALSAGTLVMKDNTLIGDCAPIIQTSDGHKEAGEKTQTVLRAQFRTLARRNHYPQVLAEAMVSKDMEVYRVYDGSQVRYMDKTAWDDLSGAEKKAFTRKETIVAKGELLTMDNTEALDLGFSRQSVQDLDQALAFLGLLDYDPVQIRETWSEALVRLLQPFLPVLMLLGIGAIYTEIKAPGFGLPGVAGIICLSLVFFNQYLVGLADYTELLLFFIGFMLLGVEVFVLPGFGIAGILGLMVITAGLVLSFQGFVLPNPDLPWEGRLMIKNLALVMGAAMGAFLVSLFLVRFVLPRASRLVAGPYLSATLAGSRANSKEAADIRPGDIGTALTILRPSGKAMIRSRKIDAITQGNFLNPGTEIEVIAVEQNHVIVQKKEV